MAVHPIKAFRNPTSRPRAIIWTGVVLLLLIVIIAVAIGATSSYWFCAEGCHKVQDDAVAAYQNSAHNQVSCLDCHMPAGGNPVVFMIHKVEAGVGELPMTIGNTFEIPLNPESRVSLSSVEFPDTQCTQCHDMNKRTVTTSSGIIFDHKMHTTVGARCTFCHNRTAHNEDGIPLDLKDPQTGAKAFAHPDYMTMDGCFRCHSLDNNAAAPGRCSACHENTADLMPEDHKDANFLDRHGKMYIDVEQRVEDTEKETGEKSPTPSSVRADLDNLVNGGTDTGTGMSKDFKYPIAPIGTVNTCYTCHTKATCESCHEQEGIKFQL